ncbi:MAG TPA: aldolase [Gemmatimonadaceae bacterium]|jgi:hypothetical protein|nr:aldolase [Gemmatimonadaceae bacterium]
MSHPPFPDAQSLADAVVVDGERVTVRDADALESPRLDALVRSAVFGEMAVRERARWLLWELARAAGVRVASMHELGAARARGEVGGFAVPAVSLRGPAYVGARAVFRVARRLDAGAFALTIARAEIAHADQRPAEYVSVVLGAALREGYRGPVFLQADHFRVNPVTYAADPEGEVAALKQLAREAVEAGCWNVDLDTSALARRDVTAPASRQQPNAEVTADVLAYLREHEPRGATICVGAELGTLDVRRHDAAAELRAFLTGVQQGLGRRKGDGVAGLSKVGVRTAAMAGRTPLGGEAVGRPEAWALAALSRLARMEYGLAGTVHYASAGLPAGALAEFARADVAQVHLGARFQQLLLDALPGELSAAMEAWAIEHAPGLRQPGESMADAVERARWKALGPFKRAIWELPAAYGDALGTTYERLLEPLFVALGVTDTAPLASAHASTPMPALPLPASSAGAARPLGETPGAVA